MSDTMGSPSVIGAAEAGPSSPRGEDQSVGYTLQGKPASVTLGRKESLSKKVNTTDQLEETKSFVSLV